MEKSEELQELKDLLDIYREDIAVFALQVFGSTLTPKQIEFCEAFRTKRTITFRGGVGFGKTHSLAVTIFWSLVCFDEVQVTIFGPSEPQLLGGVVKELKILHGRMSPIFKDAFEVSATRISRKVNPSSCFAEYRLASGDRPETAKGIHQKNNFVFVDEASGVDDVVYTEALLNILTDKNPKLVLISNPSKASGFFWRTHCDPDIKDEWTQVHGQMSDAPHFDPEKFEQIAKNMGGPLSTSYRVNVLGEFPLSDVDGLISREWIETAVLNQEVIPAPNAPIIWSVDPAGAGRDSSVMAIRHDNVLLGFEEWRNLDPTQLSFAIRDKFLSTPKHLRPSVIAVDSTGLGHGVWSNLKDFGFCPVHACIFAGTPKKPDRYHRIRDELYGDMREFFATENVSIPNHPRLIEELVCHTYDDSSGKIKLEDKKSIKKKLGGRSPDFADALAISFSVNPSRFQGKHSWSKPIEYTNLQSFQ